MFHKGDAVAVGSQCPTEQQTQGPHPHLLDVNQLGLVDLRDGDVVLGRDGEPPLGRTEVCEGRSPHLAHSHNVGTAAVPWIHSPALCPASGAASYHVGVDIDSCI